MVNYRESGPADFRELVDPLPEPIREVATRLREVIKATLPDADEAISGGARMGMALYSIGGPNDVVCGFQPTESVCRLFFHEWERLEESGYRLEGSGKHARHIKLRSREEIEPETVAEMIEVVHEAR